MQTIRTKYLGATNTKPSRFKATCDGGSITAIYDYEMDETGSQVKIAKALKNKMQRDGDMNGGHTPNGMVFVFANNEYLI